MSGMMDSMAKAHALYNEVHPDNQMSFDEFQMSAVKDMIKGDGTEPPMTFERFKEIESAMGGAMNSMGARGIDNIFRKKRNDWCATCHVVETKEIRFKSCSRCKTVKYCSKECQTSHWREHKGECKKRAAERLKSGVAAPYGGEEVEEMARVLGAPLQASMSSDQLKESVDRIQQEVRSNCDGN